jgi:hypothetical protein
LLTEIAPGNQAFRLCQFDQGVPLSLNARTGSMAAASGIVLRRHPRDAPYVGLQLSFHCPSGRGSCLSG